MSKVGAISKAQKAQNISLEKMKFLKILKSRIVPEKCKRGTVMTLVMYALPEFRSNTRQLPQV